MHHWVPIEPYTYTWGSLVCVYSFKPCAIHIHLKHCVPFRLTLLKYMKKQAFWDEDLTDVTETLFRV